MDCHPYTHPQATGRCSEITTRGWQCKSNSVAHQLMPIDDGLTSWTEHCKRHLIPFGSVPTFMFDECLSITAQQFVDQLHELDAFDDEPAAATPSLIGPAKTDDEIAAWLDSRAGLNGSMVYATDCTSCEHCHTAFTPKATGRPPRFCSTRCRVAAHRASHKL